MYVFFILKFEGAKVRKITVIANDKKQVVFYSLLFFSNRKVQHFILFSSGQLKKVYFCRRGTIKHTFKKMDIAAIIKKRRARLGLSQQDLAEFAEVGIATVKDIERGKGNPSLHTLQKIMTVLGLEMIIQTKETGYMNDNFDAK